MSPELIGILVVVFLFILIFSGVPIGFSMALMGFLGVMFIAGTKGALTIAGVVPFATLSSYIFSVLPLFLFMGELASATGLMRDAYGAAYKWLGHLPGGLAITTITGCAGFAAVCGSSVATAMTMTSIALPEMRKYKYQTSLATGCLAAGGTLGILIPPSVGFVMYGLITEQSIGKLFMAGIFPGILLALLFVSVIYIQSSLNKTLAPAGPRTSWRERLFALKDAWGVLLIFLLVMGGIYGGVFTPTEAASVGLFVVLLLALIRRRLFWKTITGSLMHTIRNMGVCSAILMGAMIFNTFIAQTGLPTHLANWIFGLAIPRLGVLICIIITYVFLGCVMETLSMVLLTLPIFFPLIVALGYDPIWFGVIVTMMSEMGLITPPIGINVFVISGMAPDIPMYTIFRGIWPFVGAMVVCVAILIAFPQIALFIPNTMMAMR